MALMLFTPPLCIMSVVFSQPASIQHVCARDLVTLGALATPRPYIKIIVRDMQYTSVYCRPLFRPPSAITPLTRRPSLLTSAFVMRKTSTS
jgi:hypothetical protein